MHGQSRGARIGKTSQSQYHSKGKKQKRSIPGQFYATGGPQGKTMHSWLGEMGGCLPRALMKSENYKKGKPGVEVKLLIMGVKGKRDLLAHLRI